jgi:hypothetical protein
VSLYRNQNKLVNVLSRASSLLLQEESTELIFGGKELEVEALENWLSEVHTWPQRNGYTVGMVRDVPRLQ